MAVATHVEEDLFNCISCYYSKNLKIVFLALPDLFSHMKVCLTISKVCNALIVWTMNAAIISAFFLSLFIVHAYMHVMLWLILTDICFFRPLTLTTKTSETSPVWHLQPQLQGDSYHVIFSIQIRGSHLPTILKMRRRNAVGEYLHRLSSSWHYFLLHRCSYPPDYDSSSSQIESWGLSMLLTSVAWAFMIVI